MTIVNESLHETADAGEVIASVSVANLTGSADCSNEFTIVLTNISLTSTALASEVIDPIRSVIVEGIASVSETFTGTSATHLFEPKGGRASERFSFGRTYTEVAASHVTDLLSPSSTVTVTGIGTATENIDPGVQQYLTLSEVLLAGDALQPGQGDLLSGEVNATDAIEAARSVTTLLSGTATAGITFDSSRSATVLTSSAATAEESFSFNGSIYSETLTATVTASEWTWAKDFGAVAWVLNTQNGALSNYTNYGFTSIAFYNNVLYATSPEGVFALDEDDDAGRPIDAVVKRGFEDLGSEETKRISDIYVGYTGGLLECDVETYDGPEDVYTYDMELRDADAPRNNRIKVGRGLSSRYWRLTFRNVDGADFQIHDLAVNVGKSKRRL